MAKSSRDLGALAVLVTFSPRLRAEQSTDEQIEAAVTNFYYMPYLSIPSVLASYQTYNTVIREVAAESNALLIENEDAIPGDGKHFTDSVHFTDKGNRLMANRVTSALLASDRVRGLLSQDRDSQ